MSEIKTHPEYIEVEPEYHTGEDWTVFNIASVFPEGSAIKPSDTFSYSDGEGNYHHMFTSIVSFEKGVPVESCMTLIMAGEVFPPGIKRLIFLGRSC